VSWPGGTACRRPGCRSRFADRTGSGAHFNMSLADLASTNLFAAAEDPRVCHLSPLGYQFVRACCATRRLSAR